LTTDVQSLVDSIICDTIAVPNEQRLAMLRNARDGAAQQRYLAAMNYKLARTDHERDQLQAQVLEQNRTYQAAASEIATIERHVAEKLRADAVGQLAEAERIRGLRKEAEALNTEAERAKDHVNDLGVTG
jgi:predicted RNase H-like nuclease (RuvC/YqgF family)